jgi:ApbE superfamily uncharacterized protein (UPF0280 family)
MSQFRVTPESLMLGSSLISTSGAGGGGESFSYGGAAAQTPAAGAWSDFVDAAGRALGDTVQTVEGMSKALSMAARAYEVADQVSSRGLDVKP